MNPIRNIFGGGGGSGGFQLPPPFNNVINFIQKLTAFAKNPIGALLGMANVNVPQNFNGTPQDLVNHLVNSGQMSKEQLDSFSQTANQIQNILPKL